MNAKHFVRMILLTAILFSSLAFTGQALAASTCGSSYTIVRGDTLRIIAEKCFTTIYALQRANPEIGTGDLIYPGKVLLLPGAIINTADGTQIYIVARGDTLKALAARFNTSVDALTRLNADILNANWIYEGQRLIVASKAITSPIPQPPSGAISTYTVLPGDSLKKIAERFNTTLEDILRVNPQIKNPNLIYPGQVISIPDGVSTYVVQKGDTLKAIAARFGTTFEKLLVLNPFITNANWIYPGQVLRVR